MPEVGIAQLRRQLKDWLERARSGDEVIVTDRGTPVARLSGIDHAPVVDKLVADGRISGAPRSVRPRARGSDRVTARGSVSDLVVAERDPRR